jgi:hypothetical protein
VVPDWTVPIAALLPSTVTHPVAGTISTLKSGPSTLLCKRSVKSFRCLEMKIHLQGFYGVESSIPFLCGGQNLCRPRSSAGMPGVEWEPEDEDDTYTTIHLWT